MKIAAKLFLVLTTITTFGAVATVETVAVQKAELDSLCRKFPLNSRCADYSVERSQTQVRQLQRDSFCSKFPLNSRCQTPPMEVIKLNLDRSGTNDEWVLIEKQSNQIKLSHSPKAEDRLTSGILNGALGFVPVPLPFVEANRYYWQEHQTIEVSFQEDRCNTDDCIVTGKNSLTLPQDADLYSGTFTIDYQEKDLKRSLSFRIPADTEAETIDTITVESIY